MTEWTTSVKLTPCFGTRLGQAAHVWACWRNADSHSWRAASGLGALALLNSETKPTGSQTRGKSATVSQLMMRESG